MMRINFSSVLADVFSQYTTADELKSAANAMCAQIKEAYEARFKELNPNAKTTSKQIGRASCRERVCQYV